MGLKIHKGHFGNFGVKFHEGIKLWKIGKIVNIQLCEK